MKINKLRKNKIEHGYKIKSKKNNYTKNVYNSYISITLDTLINSCSNCSLITYYNCLKSGDKL